ncbi:alpha/beta hydrolase family protein [Zooshikella sp. RANM57]|uniref:alpha/beta hydrolase family protein n=1 Tax=Zooshikella sp. RANM57 TaxID=3425863 RepID=UPI003D6FCE64
MSMMTSQQFSELYYFLPRIMFGGTEWGEIIDVSKKITASPSREAEKFWPQWFDAWNTHGNQLVNMAKECHHKTAATIYLKAAAAYHWAEFMFFADPVKKEQVRAKVTDSFLHALPNLSYSCERLELRYSQQVLPGYLLHAKKDQPSPCVILLNGLDSAKEVELYAFCKHFLREGISCFIFDGPGQGELLGQTAMPIEFENVFGTVLDTLRQHQAVDRNRLGVFGVSFGGYLSLRCASSFPEIKAAINLSGAFDVSNYLDINPRVRHDFRYVFHAADDQEMASLADDKLTLAGKVNPKCPVLCIHGGNDAVFPISNCQLVKDWVGEQNVTMIEYPNEAHVCQHYFHDYLPKAANWLASII